MRFISWGWIAVFFMWYCSGVVQKGKMADFDWYGTCAAVHATGACEAVLAGDTQGNIFSSFPLDEAGNYKFWVYADPYKATVTKEDGSEVEEDIYEAYNLSLLLTGQKASIPQGQGVRLFGEKYMHLQELKGEKYVAKITDAEGTVTPYNVTIDSVHVLKKGSVGIMIGVKNGYFFAAKCDNTKPEQQGALAAAALATGFYWAVGPDA